MDREVEKMPGVLWNFSQPIADNMEEAVSGVKGELAIKIFGTDLKELEGKGDEIVRVMQTIRGVQDLGLFRVIGQPNLNIKWTAARASRFGLNVSDIQDAVETAVGGKAVSQVLEGEQRYDLVVRYQPEYRDAERIDSATSGCWRLPESAFRSIRLRTSNFWTARRRFTVKNNCRYVAIKYSVRGRDLGSTVEEAIRTVG